MITPFHSWFGLGGHDSAIATQRMAFNAGYRAALRELLDQALIDEVQYNAFIERASV